MNSIWKGIIAMRDKTLKKFVANTIEYDETNEPADPFNADGMENYQEVI